MKLEDKSKVPAAFKVVMYDALCRWFEDTVKCNSYFYNDFTDEQCESADLFTKTECIGFEVAEDGLYVAMKVRGWANVQGFCIDFPDLDHRDIVDDGGWLEVSDTLAAAGVKQ